MKGTWQTTGSDGSGLALIIAVIVVAAVAVPVIHAVTALLQALVIAVAVLAGLALAAGAALLVYRVRRGRAPAALPIAQRPARVLRPPQRSTAALPAPQRPAEVHPHFHGVDAAEVAAILADVNRDHG